MLQMVSDHCVRRALLAGIALLADLAFHWAHVAGRPYIASRPCAAGQPSITGWPCRTAAAHRLNTPTSRLPAASGSAPCRPCPCLTTSNTSSPSFLQGMRCIMATSQHAHLVKQLCVLLRSELQCQCGFGAVCRHRLQQQQQLGLSCTCTSTVLLMPQVVVLIHRQHAHLAYAEVDSPAGRSPVVTRAAT